VSPLGRNPRWREQARDRATSFPVGTSRSLWGDRWDCVDLAKLHLPCLAEAYTRRPAAGHHHRLQSADHRKQAQASLAHTILNTITTRPILSLACTKRLTTSRLQCYVQVRPKKGRKQQEGGKPPPTLIASNMLARRHFGVQPRRSRELNDTL
jgi:hypothetical protein